MKSLFFLPVWNQISEFPAVLDELKKNKPPCDTILLVNSGSDDGSEKVVHGSGFPYIDVPTNRGIGYNFMLAVDWALERDYDIFGVMAANGKMLPGEMHRILDPIVSNKADYVTGCRFMTDGTSPNLPLHRRIGIPTVNALAKILTGITLGDATCGYRAYKLDILKRAEFDWHAKWLYTYGFEYYLYSKVLLERTIRWMEVPITMKYPAKGQRYSKISPLTGGFEIMWPWFAARFDGKGFKKYEEKMK